MAVLVVVDPGVQLAEGHRLGCETDPGQRPDRVTARPVAEYPCETRRDDHCARKGQSDRCQGICDVAERGDLEVGGVLIGDRNADPDDGLTVALEAHDPRLALVEGALDQLPRKLITGVGAVDGL